MSSFAPQDFAINPDDLVGAAERNPAFGAELAAKVQQSEKDLIRAKLEYEIAFGQFGASVKDADPKTSEAAIERMAKLDGHIQAQYVAYKEAEADKNFFENLFKVALQRKSSIETLTFLQNQGA